MRRPHGGASGLAFAAILFATPLVWPAVSLAAPPNTNIDSGPAAFTNQTTANFTFSSPDAGGGGSFQCKLDSGSFSVCTSPYTTPVLSEGAHHFEVRAHNAIGEFDASPATDDWTVDLTPPDTVLDSAPPALTNQTSATFEFHSEANATFECSLNGSGFAACTSPVSYIGLGDGTRNLKIQARDQAGNADISPLDLTWEVDATPPDTTITNAPAALSNAATPSFSFTSTEAGGGFECAIDGAAFAACTSPHSAAGLADGAHSFQVRATDAAGNADTTPAAHGWTRDTGAPTGKPLVAIQVAPPGRFKSFPRLQAAARKPSLYVTPRFITSRKLLIKWSTVAGAVNYDVQYLIFKSGFQPPNGPWTTWKSNTTAHSAAGLVEPGNTICIRAHGTDAAGNDSAWGSACTTLPVKAKDILKFGPWDSHNAAGYFLSQYREGFGHLRLTVANGSFGFVKRLAIVVTKCPACGKVRVILQPGSGGPVSTENPPGTQFDPSVFKTVDLTAATTKKRRVVVVATLPGNPQTLAGRNRYVYVRTLQGQPKPKIEGVGVSPY